MHVAYRNATRTDEGLALALRTATDGAAEVLGLPDYGLAVGCAADLVLVDAASGRGGRRRAAAAAGRQGGAGRRGGRRLHGLKNTYQAGMIDRPYRTGHVMHPGGAMRLPDGRSRHVRPADAGIGRPGRPADPDRRRAGRTGPGVHRRRCRAARRGEHHRLSRRPHPTRATERARTGVAGRAGRRTGHGHLDRHGAHRAGRLRHRHRVRRRGREPRHGRADASTRSVMARCNRSGCAGRWHP
jgi:hypothetical protein